MADAKRQSPEPRGDPRLREFHRWFCESFSPLMLGKRFVTMYHSLYALTGLGGKSIVETGTARASDNWRGDGLSTLVFGAWCRRFGGRLWSCDISRENIDASRRMTARYADAITFVVSDSVKFLESFTAKIDFLYLDSWDFDAGDPGPSQDHGLNEARAAEHALHERSILLIDDCGLVHGGKGGKSVPYLKAQGWSEVESQYQVLLSRSPLPATLYAGVASAV